MPRLHTFLLALAVFLPIFQSVAASRTVYRAEDISAITLYSSTAVYLPAKCPQTIEFTARARHLPELADDKIGIFPHEIIVDGNRCRSDAGMLDFAPLGPTDHYPPQWVFEDSRFHGDPVNFTCGDISFSIRFGYFNDVSTEATGGILRPDVVYFDFAVIPNTRPFGFCSYAGRRGDNKRPIEFAPFPSQRTWESFHELRKLTHPGLADTNNVEESPQPEQSMEEEEETEEEGKETGDMNELETPLTNAEQTKAPGFDRAASMDDPFR